MFSMFAFAFSAFSFSIVSTSCFHYLVLHIHLSVSVFSTYRCTHFSLPSILFRCCHLGLCKCVLFNKKKAFSEFLGIRTRMEVSKKRVIDQWKYKPKGEYFYAILSFSQISTSISITILEHEKMFVFPLINILLKGINVNEN